MMADNYKILGQDVAKKGTGIFEDRVEFSSFVALALGSDAAHSTDGITWTATTLPNSGFWTPVVYGNGKFVSVNGNQGAISSTDGITWTLGEIPYDEWGSITYGDGKFVAVSNTSDDAAYSTDGITWGQTTLPMSGFWSSIAYGNGKFVAASSSSSAYSTDGINWTSSSIDSGIAGADLIFGNGKFVAVSNQQAAGAISTDGITWTATSLPAGLEGRSLAYGDGKFVVMSSGSYSAYSTDGITWTETAMPSYSSYSSVAYGNGKFVAVKSFSEFAALSTDGISWVETSLPSYNEWATVGYGEDLITVELSEANIIYNVPENAQASISSISLINTAEENVEYSLGVVKAEDVSDSVDTYSYFVDYPIFVSLSGTMVSYSYDGITWLESTVNDLEGGEWDTIAWGNNMFVASSYGGGFGYSTNGINWTTVTSTSIGGVIFADNKFVSSSLYSSTSYTSPNGITWTASPTSFNSASMAYGDGKFIAAPFFSSVGHYSTDGVTWDSFSFPGYGNWRVAYGNGIFLTTDVSTGSQIYSSTDGITWTFLSSGLSFQFLTYSGGKFIGGNGSTLLSSTDGINWASSDGLTEYWYDAAYSNGKFVAMAVNSYYAAYSTDAISWTQVLVSTESDRRLRIGVGLSSTQEEDFTNILGQSQTIIPTRSIEPNSVDEIVGGITLSAGDQIRIYSESPDLIAQVYGVEIA
jgi:hypothetical protein